MSVVISLLEVAKGSNWQATTTATPLLVLVSVLCNLSCAGNRRRHGKREAQDTPNKICAEYNRNSSLVVLKKTDCVLHKKYAHIRVVLKVPDDDKRYIRSKPKKKTRWDEEQLIITNIKKIQYRYNANSKRASRRKIFEDLPRAARVYNRCVGIICSPWALYARQPRAAPVIIHHEYVSVAVSWKSPVWTYVNMAPNWFRY